MSTPLAILWFIAILIFLIFIHELGHFMTAKWRGVKVLEFGIGMPPRIWGKQHGETLYSLNWIPLGGFCKMLGEEDPSEKGSLAGKGAGTRLLVLSAGSLMMFIFPAIVFPAIFMHGYDVVTGGEGMAITHVEEQSPADLAGLEKGDEILMIDGTAIDSFDDLKDIVEARRGSEISMTVVRNGEEVSFKLVPRTEEETPKGQGAMGIGLKYTTIFTEHESYLPWEAVSRGEQLYWDSIVTMKDGVVAAFRKEVPFEVGGIVAAGQITTEVAKRSTNDLFYWAGLLSFNLGLVNLLPIPALDGGRIVFVLIEIARRGKRVAPETEGKIHLVGFALLIAFILFVTYQDIDRIIQGKSLLP